MTVRHLTCMNNTGLQAACVQNAFVLFLIINDKSVEWCIDNHYFCAKYRI